MTRKRSQEELLKIDPLKKSYRDRVVKHPGRFESLRELKAALLCIDMQYLDAAPGHGVFADPMRSVVPLEAQEYYFNRLEEIVFPNVRKLQDAFRSYNLDVIHIRIQSLTPDGRDRSSGHKRLGLLAAPGSKEAEFIEEVAPLPGEIIMNKTASGVFSSTNLYYVLNNMEIESLYITGVYTDECVSTTIRDASDLGFFVNLVDDGCATVTPDLHNFTVRTLKDRYTRVIQSQDVIEELQRYLKSKPKRKKNPKIETIKH